MERPKAALQGLGVHTNVNPFWLAATLQMIELKLDILGESRHGSAQWKRIVEQEHRLREGESE